MAELIGGSVCGDVVTREYVDEEADKIILVQTQDVEPILLQNEEMANNFSGYGLRDRMTCVARVPYTVVSQWIADGLNMKDQEAVFRKLNDYQYKRLRCVPGTL